MYHIVKEFLDIIDDNHLAKLYEELLAGDDSKEILDQIDSRMEYLINRARDKSFVPEASTFHKSRKHEYPGFKKQSEEKPKDPIESDIIESTKLLRPIVLPKERSEEPLNKFTYFVVDEDDLLREPADEVYLNKLAADFIDEEDVYDIKSLDPLKSRGRVNNPISIKAYPWLMGGNKEDQVRGIGCDIARYGADATILYFREGAHIVDMWSFLKMDTMETANVIGMAIREFNPDFVNIDATGGLGAAVYDMLRHMGFTETCRIDPVIMNETPRDQRLRAFNKRAEMYLLLLERFREGTISIPSDKDLIKQLAHIKYKIVGDGGAIRIAPKEEIKRELGASPDKADALALAFYSRPTFRVFV